MRGIDPVLLIVVISVLGPVIGSVLGVLKKPSLNLVSNMLSFAAGVMLAISFMVTGSNAFFQCNINDFEFTQNALPGQSDARASGLS